MTTVNTIVKKNVQKMTGWEAGEKAGFYQGKPCYGVDFFFDHRTGEIISFTSSLTIPEEHGAQGSFKVILPSFKSPKKWWERLAYLFFPPGKNHHVVWSDIPRGASEAAKINLALSVRLYNQLKRT